MKAENLVRQKKYIGINIFDEEEIPVETIGGINLPPLYDQFINLYTPRMLLFFIETIGKILFATFSMHQSTKFRLQQKFSNKLFLKQNYPW